MYKRYDLHNLFRKSATHPEELETKKRIEKLLSRSDKYHKNNWDKNLEKEIVRQHRKNDKPRLDYILAGPNRNNPQRNRVDAIKALEDRKRQRDNRIITAGVNILNKQRSERSDQSKRKSVSIKKEFKNSSDQARSGRPSAVMESNQVSKRVNNTRKPVSLKRSLNLEAKDQRKALIKQESSIQNKGRERNRDDWDGHTPDR